MSTDVSVENGSSTTGRLVAFLLLFVQAFSVLLFGGVGLFIAFVSDSCGSSSTCDDGRIAAGMMIPLGVSALFFLISLVQTIRRVRANRSAWWVPLVWTFLSASGIVIGFAVAASGVAPNHSLV
jgi:hypothetical protein